MARNIHDQIVTHLSEYSGLHIGNKIGIDTPEIPAVDSRGVCMVRDGEIVSITEFNGTVRMQVITVYQTDKVTVERCTSYTIGGRLFNSLYPPTIDELPVLVSHKELMAELRK